MYRYLTALVLCAPLLSCASAPVAGAAREEQVDGYLEWRDGRHLVVDGQRIAPTTTTRYKGKARDFGSIPLGFEVKAKGIRRGDGVIYAREIEAKPNGQAMFEGEIKKATDEAEAEYRKAGRFFEQSQDGVSNIGTLHQSGPHWQRTRRIMDQLVPPYMNPEDVRVYVIENEEWNAFAMGNYSIYVFSGLLDDMDDDEVALVLGHELVHASHEHTRRHFKNQMLLQLGALGITLAAEEIDNDVARTITQVVAGLGAVAWSSGYGRRYEDQADRVGLRYAYQGGFDVTKGPNLWRRFAERYGEQGRVVNFFFGDHSLATKRAQHLERELALNYRDGPRSGPGRVRNAGQPSPSPRRPAPHPKDGSRDTTRAWAPATSSPRQIRVGMTQDEVLAIAGRPQDEVAFGRQIRWTYSSFTVFFENGRVKQVRH